MNRSSLKASKSSSRSSRRSSACSRPLSLAPAIGRESAWYRARSWDRCDQLYHLQPSTAHQSVPQALELSHRLSTSKIPVVASTASATLRQLFMFVFERVGEEDALVSAAQSVADPVLLAALPPASFNLDVPPVEHDAAAPVIPVEQGKEEEAEEAKKAKSIALRPVARDAYLLLEDLCLLISGSADGGPDGEPSFLRWGSLSRTFGLELVESIVSGFGPVVRTVSCRF